MKKFLIAAFVLILIVAVGVLSYLKGIDKVRSGLVANYPTVKNLVQGTAAEFDSVVTVSVTKPADETLFNLLKGDSKSDTVRLSVPYYGRYGIDLSVRSFRLFRDGQTAEVWLPPVHLLYCELKFDRISLNGKPGTWLLKSDSAAAIKKRLNEKLFPVIENDKANQKATRAAIVKTLMFYFMPYKFDLKVYIDSEQQTLPKVPGINQSVDEAIRQMIGK